MDGVVVGSVEVVGEAYESLPPTVHVLREEVRRAVLKLPLPYREAVVLAHIGGFSYREIAQILHLPLGTVMSRLFRGRRLLRAYLRDLRNPSGLPRCFATGS